MIQSRKICIKASLLARSSSSMSSIFRYKRGMSLLFWEILLSFFPLSISTTEIDPCVSYSELRDSHRSQFHRVRILGLPHCDRDLPIGWYRFKGPAGLKMPEACVKSGSCGTHAPGWFQGSHPTQPGAVSPGRVCFTFMGSCCHWFTPVKVKKCNGFYIYRLPQTSLCDLQYCGDGAADADCAADNNNVTINGSVPGSLLSPNFPGHYPNNLQCTWRVTVPEGMRVRLVLKNMTFGSYDYIVFRDGLQDDSPQISKYADCATGELRLYSTDRYMLVKFVSDGSETGSGFRLEYEGVSSSKISCSPSKDICSQSTVVRNLSGIIRSPGMPGSPSGNLSCHWKLHLPVGYKMLIDFSWFGMAGNERQSFCTDGHIKIRKEGDEQWKTHCGCELPPKQLYDSAKVYTVFNNSLAVNQAGFLFSYRAIAADECTDDVDSCEMRMDPVGLNRDGDLCYEPTEQTTTTSSPSPVTVTKPADYTIDVTCNKDDITAVLHVRNALNFDPESVHLNDTACKPTFQNSTRIIVKTTLEDCGTTSYVSEDGEMIVYRNAIYADIQSKGMIGSGVTRDHQAVFEFQCRYKRRAVLSSVSFDPSKRLIITDIESFGNFTFEMNMFKSGNFRDYYTEYPVGPIDVGAEIFLQVSLNSNDSGIVVLVEECKATPTANYDDQVHYIFIEDGCSKDNTLQYNYTLSPVQRFSLSAFSFRFVKSNEVFLHCKVRACLGSDASSRCTQGCPFGKRRKRRNSQYEVDRLLAVGPIIVSQSRQPIAKTAHLTRDEGTIAVGFLVGVLGFIVVLLLAAVVAILCKPDGTPKPNGAATLLVREDEPGFG